MRNFFALFSILLLVAAGIRAPEGNVLTNGLCTSGPVLAKSVSQNDAPEFQRTASHPLTIYSGFAPSFQPFDLPSSPVLAVVRSVDFLSFSSTLSLKSQLLFPHDRPPIVSFF